MDGFLTPDESEALLLSLRISFVAVFGALPLAFCAALLLARTRFFGKTLVDGLIHVPLVLPPVAIGFLLLIVFGTRHGLGGWLFQTFGIRFVFSWTARRWRRRSSPSRSRCAPYGCRWNRSTRPGYRRGARRAGGTGAGIRLLHCRASRRHHHRLRRQPRRVRRSSPVSNIPGETRLTAAIYTALQAPGGEAEAARLSAMSIVLALIFMTAAEIVQRRARERG